ncbi:MAG: response regulator, partial [Chloroflexi bacterium]|nr:response regulator [Chloroflexota bacterium]
MTDSDPQTVIRRVLVIDDEDSVRTALQASIETFDGFEVDTAPDGEVGLEMIARERYDAVLVDLVMPVIDGFEVLRQLRELGASARPVRVILVRGMSDPALQGNVRELG